MTRRNSKVLLTAMRTAVGLTAEASAASVRAGISRVQEHPFIVDVTGEPLTCALVPSLDPEILGPERIYALAQQTLADVGRQVDGLSVSLLLGLPEYRPGWGDAEERELCQLLVLQHGGLHIEDARVAARGHASALVAVGAAADTTSRGTASAVLVLGVDSYLDPQTIGAFTGAERLAQAAARSRFVPGEAAAAVLVGRPEGPLEHLGSLGMVAGFGLGTEPNPLDSDRECLASGLRDALGEAMAAIGDDRLVSQTFIDINGERHREEEWGMAMFPYANRFEDPLRYVAAARAWGDIGAASGAAFVSLATQAWARGYARGPKAALVAGSDAGERAVVVLGEPAPRHGAASNSEAPPSHLEPIDPVNIAAAPPPSDAEPDLPFLNDLELPELGTRGADNVLPISPAVVDTVKLDPPLNDPKPDREIPNVTELIAPFWEDAANMPPKPMDEPIDPTKTVRHQGRKRKGRRPGRITLQVLDGPDAGTEQVITGRRVRVGRSEAADFTVAHPSLSGLHFELRVRRNGIELFDLASKNGTTLFGRVVFHARVQLGDVIKAGDCSIKLVDSAEIEVERATEARQDGLLGISEAIQETFATIDSAASCDLPTLVCGETGTGKEVAARAIHRRSKRNGKPFVVLDCSAIPNGLAESMILGHSKGAFTGADADSPGPFERASGGTLFLDEIGELPLLHQVKLLRALATGQVVRVGESEARKVDVRVIAATHRDLPRMVDAGSFRQDLYYRLAGLVVELPTLSERGAGEIEYLAREFASRREGPPIEFGGEALAALREYAWPGNVRELGAVVARAAATCSGSVVTVGNLALGSGGPRLLRLAESARLLSYDDAHAELDRVLLPRILAECGGDLDDVAQRLGRSRRALEKRLRDLRICVGVT